MTDRQQIAAKARTFFDDLWRDGDPWDLEANPYERAKYDAQLALLDADRGRYGRALEIGCAGGVFTRRLAGRVDSVLALDVAEPAIAMARERTTAGNIEYQLANIMDCESEIDGPWDLIVFAETVGYLGWLYPFFDVAWLAHRLFENSRPGGRLLLTNTCAGVEDYLYQAWIIRSYHDLFRNAGFVVLQNTMFKGVKNGVEIEAMLTLAQRPD